MNIRSAPSTLSPVVQSAPQSAEPGKSYDPFNGDRYLSLYKTLAVDTPAQKAHKAASPDFSAIAHIHMDDEGKMLKGIARMPVPAEELAKRALEGTFDIELSEPCLPAISEFPGTYEVPPENGYVVTSFRLDPEDVVPGVDANSELGKLGAQAAREGSDDGEIAAYLMVRKSKTVFKNNFLGFIFKRLPGDVLYILTVSTNGLVRFHLPKERSIFSKLLFSFADSEPRRFSWFKNLHHAIRYGCYCFGLFFRGKAKDSSDENGGRPVLMRYNRWAKEVSPFWVGVNSAEKAGASVSK